MAHLSHFTNRQLPSWDSSLLQIFLLIMCCQSSFTQEAHDQYPYQNLYEQHPHQYEQDLYRQHGNQMQPHQYQQHRHQQMLEEFRRDRHGEGAYYRTNGISENSGPNKAEKPIVTDETDVPNKEVELVVYDLPGTERLSRTLDFFKLIVPGTKWCGPTNVAKNETDFGIYEDVDICCWRHDHCDHIETRKRIDNVVNESQFAVMNCRCEHDFNSCLMNTRSYIVDILGNRASVGDAVGIVYFNNKLREPKCFAKSIPPSKCILTQEIEDGLGKHKRCVKYHFKRGVYQAQIFDIPLYIAAESVDSRSVINYNINQL